jgi:protein TonB
MQLSPSSAGGTPPALTSPMTSRPFAHYAPALAMVALAHAGALAWLMHARLDAPAEVTIESKPIMAELLRSPPPAPVAVQSEPAPAPKPKPVATPRPVAKPTPKSATPKPAPPAPVRDIPSQATPAATPAPATMANASPAQAEPAPATPSPRPVIAQGAPKGVAKLDCQIAKPDYPALSKRREEMGTVIVNLVLDADGKVERATVKKSSGYDRLDDAARTAALGSTCRPYVENGQPIRVMADQPYVFNLGD